MTKSFMYFRWLVIFQCLTLSYSVDSTEITLQAYSEIQIGRQQGNVLFTNPISFLDHSKIPYTLTIAPWIRVYNYALTTPNTFIFPIYKTAKREQFFHWFCPIAPAKNFYLFRMSKREDLQLETLEHAKKHSIGTVSQHMITQYLQDQGFSTDTQLDVSPHAAANLSKLVKGRTDFIFW